MHKLGRDRGLRPIAKSIIKYAAIAKVQHTFKANSNSLANPLKTPQIRPSEKVQSTVPPVSRVAALVVFESNAFSDYQSVLINGVA